ncbi:MAG: hypothetical protein WCR29_05305 [Bacteroidales bacterium]
MLQFFLEDGSKISVRPSGTEPKIKFYFGVFNKLNSIKEFPELSKQADDKINAIIKEFGLKIN